MPARFFDRTGQRYERFNYLGEWHSHPSFAVAPSVDDVRAMSAIVANPRTAIIFAALLTLRLRWRLWLDYSLTLFARGQEPRALRMTPRVRWI